MQTTQEEWKSIPGFDGYRASSDGRVRNRNGRVLTGTVNKRGHRQVNVRGLRRRMTVAVHRLVASAFLGPPRPPTLLSISTETGSITDTAIFCGSRGPGSSVGSPICSVKPTPAPS